MHDILTKIKFIGICGLLLLATYNISKTTYEIYKSSRRLEELHADLELKKVENTELKQEFERKTSAEFIEEEARNKLSLVKPGEKLVVAPEITKLSSPSAVRSEQNAPSNLSKWLSLFF